MTSQNGILLIDKSKGISSAQALNIVKKRLKLAKIGHSGTLDPFASGLLVALSGSCTKLAFVPEAALKEYTGEITFGAATDTDDLTGKIIKESSHVPTLEELQKVIPEYIGSFKQTPPVYSALKIDGKRAYALARAGSKPIPPMPPRQVYVKDFSVEPIDKKRFGFKLVCGKGFYLRALARDLGERLQSAAHLSLLRRTRVGEFAVEQAKSPEEIEIADLLSFDTLFSGAHTLVLEGKLIQALRNGNLSSLETLQLKLDNLQSEEFIVYRDQNDNPQGILKVTPKGWGLIYALQSRA
ncbi:MAG TPA: tRNA pseudouridine(55) synthase TruB [Oligoflexia bacterium]|nr:tRNA pseudouridine(55) synthase TruB [Oligoflexia bacterium]HMP27616.1 tRNA pseudouridine(55) synthase TruB [Oligoflexia bacterium]